MGQLPQNPAAHLMANSSQQPGTPLRWLSDMDQAFLQQGMELSADGRELLVPRAGLYFLYAQATFSSSSSSPGAGGPCGGRPEPLSLQVERHSPSYPDFVPLLSAARSPCPPGGPGRFWTVPLYQAALFKLLGGDRLRVTAGPLGLLDDQKTFLGAFAVAPELQ
nr:PREDICTED: lymphotoxin-alpha-like [Lepisosteus oculatus]